MNDATKQFIEEYKEKDVRMLALKADRNPDVDMPLALRQITGWQMARKKLPSWASVPGILYPRHLSMEQCSSERTAEYKAGVAAKSRAGKPHATEGARTVVDLTGGFGVDFVALARGAGKAVYVERDEELCRMARHNFPRLGIEAEVVNVDAEDYLRRMDHADLLFIDPARRDGAGRKMVGIADCTPDILRMKDEMLGKADRVMIKLSPMLDWHKAVEDLGDCVSEVHIVSVRNECKELLVVCRGTGVRGYGGTKFGGTGVRGYEGTRLLYCVNDDDEVLVVNLQNYSRIHVPPYPRTPGKFLYEPNASIMKSGCFDALCEKYGVAPLGRNSHLFTSDREIDCFPGRKFCVEAAMTMNKRDMRQLSVTRANVAVRNFPISAEELRKRLKLSDGGDTYIFGTTLDGGRHILIMCRKT